MRPPVIEKVTGDFSTYDGLIYPFKAAPSCASEREGWVKKDRLESSDVGVLRSL